MTKSLVKFTFWGILSLVLIAVLLGPVVVYWNQSHVLDIILKKVNADQSHHLAVQKLNISPFESFPYISIDLENATVIDSLHLTDSPLVHFEHIYVGLDVVAMLQGNYTVKRIHVKNGALYLKNFADGTNNFTFKRKSENAKDGEEGSLNLDLDEIELLNVNIHYYDAKMHAEDHFQVMKAASTIDIAGDFVNMHLTMDAQVQDMILEGYDFFKQKHLTLEGDWIYNTKTQFLAINPTRIGIEKAEFELSGSFDSQKNNLVDLHLFGKKSNFDILIALSPPAAGELLKNYENSGDIYFKGEVKGEISEDKMPAINFEFGCKNASFINPESKKSIKDLDFKGYFTNGEKRNLETTVFFLENFKGNPENSFIAAKFKIADFTNPKLLVDFHALFDLNTLQALYQIPDIENMNGKLKMDLTLDEFVNTEDMNATLAKIKEGAKSQILLDNVSIKSKKYPHAIQNLNGTVSLERGGVSFDKVSLQVGKSDFTMTGRVVNIMKLMHGKEQEIDLLLDFEAKKIDLFDLLAPLDSTPDKRNTIDETITDFEFKTELLTSSKYLTKTDSLPVGKFFVKDLHFKLKNYPHFISEITAKADISAQALRLEKFAGKIDNKLFLIDLALSNPNALMHPEKKENVRGSIAVDIPLLKLEEILVYKDISFLPKDTDFKTFKNLVFKMDFSSTNQQLRQFEGMPEGDFAIENLACQIEGLPFNLDYLKGKLHFENHILRLDNLGAKIGHTDIQMTGTLKNYLRPQNDTLKFPHITNLKLKANTIDLDELMRYQPKPNPKNQAHVDTANFNVFKVPFPDMYVEAEIGKFTYHKYLIENIKGTLHSTPNHRVELRKMSANTAGGELKIDGYFNGANPDSIYLSSEVDVNQMNLEMLFFKFDNFGQTFLLQNNIKGQVSGKIKSKVLVHSDLSIDLHRTTAHVEASISNGELINFEPFQAMESYMGDKNLKRVRFDKIENTLDIKNGVVSIPKMVINSSIGYLLIDGKQSVDLNMDYQIQVPFKMVKKAIINAVFKKKKKPDGTEEEVKEEDLPEDEIVTRPEGGSGAYIYVHVLGKPASFKIKVGRRK